jgi:nitronate monooxygenase
MTLRTSFSDRFGLALPVIQAPMGGGATTAVLVAAVSNAGALGCMAGAYRTAAQIIDDARAVRALTARPFGINVFAPLPTPALPRDAAAMVEKVAAYHAELGLPAPAMPPVAVEDFDAQLEAVLESGASLFSVSFGRVPADAIERARGRGMLVVGTATTVEEARLLEADGVDAVVAQGSEAGAHRGTFAAAFEDALVGTVALVPQVVDAVRVPVIASGGIMDGRGIVAALALGAAAVQMGTAFLTTHESGVPDAYKDAVLSTREDGTRVTRAFSGRPARGIVNRVMAELDGQADAPILPYPAQNALTRPMRAEAARRGRAEYLSLWAGQGAPLARREPAAELVERLDREAEAALARLAR